MKESQHTEWKESWRDDYPPTQYLRSGGTVGGRCCALAAATGCVWPVCVPVPI